MNLKKIMVLLLKGLAIFGAIVVAAMFMRSKKKADSGSGTIATNFKDEISNGTRLGMISWLFISIGASLTLLATLHHSVESGVALALVWGTIGASTTGSFNITFVPQFIGFTASSAPSAFTINVLGDGVTFNLDTNGMTAMRNIRFIGIVNNQYVFQLANGLINGKNGVVTVTNTVAGTLTINCWSRNWGDMYYTYLTQRALQNSGINLRKFAYAAFPSAGAADSFTIEYNNGLNQISLRDDLNLHLGYTQNQVASNYNVDNIAPAMVDTLTYIPTTDQNVYVMQYQAAKGAVNAAVVAKG